MDDSLVRSEKMELLLQMQGIPVLTKEIWYVTHVMRAAIILLTVAQRQHLIPQFVRIIMTDVIVVLGLPMDRQSVR